MPSWVLATRDAGRRAALTPFRPPPPPRRALPADDDDGATATTTATDDSACDVFDQFARDLPRSRSSARLSKVSSNQLCTEGMLKVRPGLAAPPLGRLGVGSCRRGRSSLPTGFMHTSHSLQTKCTPSHLTSQVLQQQIRKGRRRSSLLSFQSNLVIHEPLGRGGFGHVYRGTWHTAAAAIKVGGVARACIPLRFRPRLAGARAPSAGTQNATMPVARKVGRHSLAQVTLEATQRRRPRTRAAGDERAQQRRRGGV